MFANRLSGVQNLLILALCQRLAPFGDNKMLDSAYKVIINIDEALNIVAHQIPGPTSNTGPAAPSTPG